MSHFTGAIWTDRGIDLKMAAARMVDLSEIVLSEGSGEKGNVTDTD